MLDIHCAATTQVSAKQLVISTAQVVFAPVALGLLLAAKARPLTQKIERVAPLTCVILVACICGSVVASNAAAVAACGARVVAAVACMHAGGFLLGYFSAMKAGLGERAARTVSCTAICYYNAALKCLEHDLQQGLLVWRACSVSWQ